MIRTLDLYQEVVGRLPIGLSSSGYYCLRTGKPFQHCRKHFAELGRDWYTNLLYSICNMYGTCPRKSPNQEPL